MCVGLLLLIVGYMVQEPYAATLSADAETRRLTLEYLLWFIPSLSLQFALIAMASALRGTGHFKPGMVVQTATVILNIILAPILVFGWGTGIALGVAGAALATFISIVIGVIWMTFYFLPSSAYIRFSLREWKPNLGLWRDLLKIGLPAGAEFALLAVYLIIVYIVSRPFGAASQAGFGIGLRIVQASFLPVVALGFAVSPVAGQNFGARRADRVKETFKVGSTLAAAAMLILATITWLGADRMMGIFSSDPMVIAVGKEYLHIVALNFVASGIIFVASSTFQAMGNAMPALLASGARIVIIAVPVLLLSKVAGFTLLWVWYISAGAVVVQLAMSLLLLRREFRVRLNFSAAPSLIHQARLADVRGNEAM
jgi:putative MATE family efflux protein